MHFVQKTQVTVESTLRPGSGALGLRIRVPGGASFGSFAAIVKYVFFDVSTDFYAVF
jgi:hypothetical protein